MSKTAQNTLQLKPLALFDLEPQPIQEFKTEMHGGYRVEMTYNPKTGISKLRDGPEVLTVPFQRRLEYAAWLRECADRLEAIEFGEPLEAQP